MPEPASPRRFLVPVDHPHGSSDAIAVASYLARAVNGSLTLLAVVPLAVPPAGIADTGTIPVTLSAPERQETIDRLARERLDEVAGGIGDDLDVRTELSWGPAGPAIVDAVNEHGYDLVVVPSRREGTLGHLVHDHAVRQVLHHSPVPVLVVPTDDALHDG